MAERDGVVIGVVIAKNNIIQAFFVKPTVHRQGIGRELFQCIEKEIMKAGFSVMQVTTATSGVPFYSNMGMIRTGSFKPKSGSFYGVEFISLEKTLSVLT